MSGSKIGLLVVEIFERARNLVLAFLIKYDFEGSGIVVNLKQSSHGLFLAVNDSANNYDLKLSNKHNLLTSLMGSPSISHTSSGLGWAS